MFNGYKLRILDKKICEQYAKELAKLADQIPQVRYTEKEILAESKKDRIFLGKWEHSLVLFDGNKPIALIIGYERKSENNEQYPENTLYISELAVAEDYQNKGIGRKILLEFLKRNKRIGFKYLKGKLNFSVQTNSAEWNKYVQDLYKSLGFAVRSQKDYSDRIDIILGYKPN